MLAPGESRSASIDLGEYYAAYEAGPYNVAYDVDARGHLTGAPTVPAASPVFARYHVSISRLYLGPCVRDRNLHGKTNLGLRTGIATTRVATEKI
jgi:hypothetical protein